MIRRMVTIVMLAMLPALFGAVAWADVTTPYPAPSVSSGGGSVPTTQSIQVLPTSAAVSGTSGSGLAYTGVSVNVTLTAIVAAVVLLVGIGLVVLGARRLRGERRG